MRKQGLIFITGMNQKMQFIKDTIKKLQFLTNFGITCAKILKCVNYINISLNYVSIALE